MGTRGAIGFCKNGVDKITYNHYDSYPSGLGNNVVDFIKSTTIKEMSEVFDKIVLIKDNEVDYKALRDYQGDLSAYKRGITRMINNATFMQDSLFCEWAYIINLDTNKLEVYKGFNQVKSNNRYQPKYANGQGYWGVSLFIELPLNDIPDKIMDELEEAVYEED